MPRIKRYLEIYNARGGFSSLPSFAEGCLNTSIQGTLHTDTPEPILDKLGIARTPCSFVTSEGPSSDDNTSGSLQSLLGTSSGNEFQLGDGALEDTNTGFLMMRLLRRITD